MAMTLDTWQKLDDAGLVAFYTDAATTAKWLAASMQAKAFLLHTFPNGTNLRPDDLAKALAPVVEVDGDLRAYLAVEKLKQKYWFTYFTDLVVERTWPNI